MTQRIREFLRKRNEEGPCLVVDLAIVRDNYNAFAKALPDTRVFYAVKANPAPEVLGLLASLGSCFDTASISEIDMVLATGAMPDRISYGNTIKKERDIARAYALGVRLYAVDCKAEVEKVARAAPGSRVFCRILSDCVGAEWPLSRKFGCEPAMAVDVLEHALRAGLEPVGVSFHVGSQQRNQHAWDRALASAAAVFRECGERGINLTMVNLGGGFPTKYLKNVPSVKTYGTAIFKALRKHFGNRIPETIIESSFPKRARRMTFAGSISTSASLAVWPKPWTSRSATRFAPRGTAMLWHLACWQGRPATPPTFCTRRSPTCSRSLWRSATRC
jgi:ornithine decarboxylase